MVKGTTSIELTAGAGFSSFDIHFGRFMAGLDAGGGDAVLSAAAMLSRAVRGGDSCLDLEAIAGAVPSAGISDRPLPSLTQWVQRLRASKIVGEPGQMRPLILDSRGRLYLYRYWRYERKLAEAILSRAARPLADLDRNAVATLMSRYFPGAEKGGVDRQRAAALMALLRQICVITGGPGTGKTHTIANILAIYCELNRQRAPRVLLAAPTGKAAARLKTSLAAGKDRMNADEALRRCIPEDVFTLHRLLGATRESSRYRYHAEKPLPADMVVVDEASMVDLAMMSKLVQALPDAAHLVLLGDRDQLASVEAGSVLGDICGADRDHLFSRAFCRRYAGITGERLQESSAGGRAAMVDAIVTLQHNYRFARDSGIGALSHAVNAGEVEAVLAMLGDPREDAVAWLDPETSPDGDQWLRSALLDGYGEYLRADTPGTALEAFQRFQVLCAVKRGPHGAESVNRMAETVLQRNGLLRTGGRDPHCYHGRPVLITRNDYDLQLFNGDVGLMWRDDRHPDTAVATCFPDESGGVRKIWPHRLPAHETVFAMTVHKSQGSEFDHVLLILPPRDNPLLTRELVYTAVSRARTRVTVWAPRAVLKSAVARRLKRSSGLRDALWGCTSQAGAMAEGDPK